MHQTLRYDLETNEIGMLPANIFQRKTIYVRLNRKRNHCVFYQVVHDTNQDILMEQEKEEVKLQSSASSEQKDSLEKEDISAPPKRNRSFAPQNFVFKPPKGLTTYRVKPMSPSRANVFLSPNLSWSPSETIK